MACAIHSNMCGKAKINKGVRFKQITAGRKKVYVNGKKKSFGKRNYNNVMELIYSFTFDREKYRNRQTNEYPK